MHENDLSAIIVDWLLSIFIRSWVPVFMESVYEEVLCYEFNERLVY